MGRKFTILPAEWKQLFPNNNEIHQWFGVPLLLKKSLYGDRAANLAWDGTQSSWLTSSDIGFERLPSDGSIYVKRSQRDVMMVLNAVDDQLYFATNPKLKTWFEQVTQARFDVSMLGQAKWYLQSRITQLADFSIILDQSRYAALITARYLPPTSIDSISDSRKAKYASPLPASPTFTKNDCSKNYAAVMRLQEE